MSLQPRTFQDAAGTEYKVLPLIWVGGYQTFYRKRRSKWKRFEELPIRVGAEDAQKQLTQYGNQHGWTMI